MKAVSEVIRVLRPKGKALIYVWAMEQDYEKTPSKYITNSRHKAQLAENDKCCLVQQLRTDSGETAEEAETSESKHQPAQPHGIDGSENINVPPADVNSAAQLINIRRKPVEGLEVSTDNCDTGTSRDDCGVDSRNSSQSESSTLPDVSKKLHIHVNRTQFKEQDMLVPWQLKCKLANEDKVEAKNDNSSVFHRFYHVFRQGELEALCKKVPGCEVKTRYYDQGNWCVIVEKL